MNARPPRSVLVAVGALVVALATVALAWACVPGSQTFSISPQSGPPGTTVTVSSSDFPNGPVEIVWDGQRKIGEATAVGGRFSTSVTVPADATPDVHHITARPTGCGGHDCHGGGTAAFQVTGGSPRSGTPAPGAQRPTASRRARAIAKCKRRYRGSSRRAKVRRKSCIAKARRRYRA